MKILLPLIFCVPLLSHVSAAAPKPRTPLDRPNIILIMADDVGWEAFGSYGAEDYRTPHLDELARRGVRFEHCYSTPICTTSRVKLMTGKYNFRNYTHFGYLSPDEKTFAHLLRDAGYATAIAGKWQLNGIYNELPHHQDNTRPHQSGFDEYCLWQLTTGKNRDEGGGERFWSPPFEMNGQFITVEQNQDLYGPDLLCDFLCDFMERHRDQPFFAYYPMLLVHDPFVATPDTIGDRPRDQSANRQPRDSEARKENFVAMVEYMDKIVGRLHAKIEELGLGENTIILFTSDNGTHPSITSRWKGQDIRGGKAEMTNMGTHVPLIVSWEGTATENTVLEDLVHFTDFYPTLAEAAGVTLGDEDPIDGVSFLPRLRGEPGNPRDWLLCHYQPYWNKEPGQFARDAEFKLYRDGRFFQVPNDLEEKEPLPPGTAGTRAEAVRRQLERLLERCPPAPSGLLGRDAKSRPVYPEWPNLLDPND